MLFSSVCDSAKLQGLVSLVLSSICAAHDAPHAAVIRPCSMVTDPVQNNGQQGIQKGHNRHLVHQLYRASRQQMMNVTCSISATSAPTRWMPTTLSFWLLTTTFISPLPSCPDRVSFSGLHGTLEKCHFACVPCTCLAAQYRTNHTIWTCIHSSPCFATGPHVAACCCNWPSRRFYLHTTLSAMCRPCRGQSNR